MVQCAWVCKWTLLFLFLPFDLQYEGAAGSPNEVGHVYVPHRRYPPDNTEQQFGNLLFKTLLDICIYRLL